MSVAPTSLQKRCLYCGNNQTNHAMSWISGGLSGVLAGPTEKLAASRVSKLITIVGEKLFSIMSGVWFLTGIARWESDRSKVVGDRAGVLWQEAEARGIDMENLWIGNRATDIYRAKLNSKWFIFNGLPRPAGTDVSALMWMDDKAILKERLSRKGISVSRGGSFFSYTKALAMFNTLGKPVIVKPRFGSRGRHTTTLIRTEEEFKMAFQIAKKLCPFIVVEEHLFGPVYRGTMVGGRAVGILSGEPPRITGDGVHTIDELIEIKDKHRPEGMGVVPRHRLLGVFLKKQGFGLETVLLKDVTIDLTEKIGVSYGGKSIEFTETTHPKFKAYLEEAARVVGDPILGFDFIALDVTKDPDSQRWGIIECNGTPFINLHHDPLIGKPQNVAAKVWDLFKTN